MTLEACPLCGSTPVKTENFSTQPPNPCGFMSGEEVYTHIYCEICKDFYITFKVHAENFSGFISNEDKSRLSGYFRELWEYAPSHVVPYKSVILDSTNFQLILADMNVPKKNDLEIKFIKLLRYIRFKSSFFGEDIEIMFNNDYPLAYAINSNEFVNIIIALEKQGYLERKPVLNGTGCFLSLTLKGISYIQEKNPDSTQIFVALDFQSELKKFLSNGNIKEKIKNATGFSLLTVDEPEHNGKITDRMISEINKSRAVIADFSDNNCGAYYEAGYGHGLGLDVIFICKDGCDEQSKKLIDKVHFDINHYKHLLWTDEEDLTHKLINRINATLGIR